MSPSSSNHPCEHCFLQEQRQGRVCPAAHDVYGLSDLQAQQQSAEALRQAITQDAQIVVQLPALVQLDAQLASALPDAERLGLVAAATDPLSTTSRKETIRVLLARPLR
jgi:hypothetical protein